MRVRSHRWTDAALIAALSVLVFVRLRKRAGAPDRRSDGAKVALAHRLRSPGNLLLLAILAAAALGRFWALTFGFPHPAARPDEEAVSSLAGNYYHGNFEQTDFTYPPLYILAVAATLWLVFRGLPPVLSRMNLHLGLASNPGTVAQRTAARVLSATSGVLSVWLLFRIGSRLFGRATGLTAAACLAAAFLHVRDSHFGVTDVPMTFMVLAAFLAVVKLSETGSNRDLLTAGIVTGLAVATKYNAALVALPAAFAILHDPLRRPLAARLGRVVALGAIMTIAYLVVSPYSLVHYLKFLEDVSNVSRHLAVGHGAELGRGWTYHLTATLRYGLGLPLLAAGALGLGWMIWREGRRGILVALFPITYYLVIGSGRTVFARYILPAVPFLCLGAGYAIVQIAGAVTAYVHRPGWRTPATALMTTAVLWPSLLSVIAFDRLIAREDSRVLARRWVESRLPLGAAIGQVGLSSASSGHVYIGYETDYYKVADATATAELPIVIVVSSPLGAPDLETIRPWLERDYDLQFVQNVVAEDDRANVYDWQDDFYLPIAGFHNITRPGPNVRIYVRRGSPLSATPSYDPRGPSRNP